jgi:hypothetical protein
VFDNNNVLAMRYLLILCIPFFLISCFTNESDVDERLRLEQRITQLERRMDSILGNRLSNPAFSSAISPSGPVQRESFSSRCQAITKKGSQCKRTAKNGGYCWQHGG